MDADELRAQMAAVASAHGPWHSHNIHLGDGVWTISDRAPAETGRVRRYLQLVSDAAGSPPSELRVLDLACEEGAFGIEMARGGAEVVAVEGRAANVARARFAAQALGLDRYEVHEEDVRNVDAGSYGEFDVVLNIGILYHLDQPAVFKLLENLALMCRRVMMLSTHHSRFAERTVEWGGRRYSGSYVVEHRPDADPDTRRRNLRASLDNTRSFWLTRPSLYNLLADVGFSSVVELRMPRHRVGEQPGNIVNLLAFRGQRFDVPRSPRPLEDPAARWPEREPRNLFGAQTIPGRIRDRLRHNAALTTIYRRLARLRVRS